MTDLGPLTVPYRPDAPGLTVTREAVIDAGRRALEAYEAIPYENDLTGTEVWMLLGRAALGLSVTDTPTDRGAR